MNSEIWVMFFKIVIFLPFILFAVYASIKYGGTKLQDMQKGKYIKIIERVSLTKESSLLVVNIGGKGYLMSCNSHRTEILQELSEEEFSNVQKNSEIPTYKNLKEFSEAMQKKLKIKKEGNHEKNML